MTEQGLSRLAEDEGFSGTPYLCTSGKTTIGFGFNLEAWPLTEEECLPILKSRCRQVQNSLETRIPFFKALPERAQDVLVNMGYQLGVSGLLGFKRFLRALELRKFEDAYHEGLQSTWAQQTPNRARRLMDIIRSLG